MAIATSEGLSVEAYAKAFFDIAKAENKVSQVKSDLFFVSQLFKKERALWSFINDNKIAADRRAAALEEVLKEKVLSLTLGQLSFLIYQRKEKLIYDFIDKFNRLIESVENKITAEVRTAVPIGDVEQQKIKTKLESLTGKVVDLQLSVEPGIVGGLVIKIGDRVIDASVRSQLAKLHESLKKRER